MSIGQAVEDLYIAHWGEATRRARFQDSEFTIDVLTWDAGTTSEGVTLYATVGGSASVTPPPSGHLVEFLLGLSPARDEVASAIAGLGLYAAHHDVELDHCHTVPSDHSLWPGTTIRHFLIVRPLTDFFAPLLLPEGRHVEFLQAIPIFETEIVYKSRNGVDALLARWEGDRVRFWNPDREPHP